VYGFEGSVDRSDCSLPICLAGQYLNASRNACTPCPRGYYQVNKIKLNNLEVFKAEVNLPTNKKKAKKDGENTWTLDSHWSKE
jgi:hypothetical protein